MDGLIHILFNAHSDVRWLVLFAAVVAVLKFAWGWARSSEFKAVDRALAAAFSGLIDLQATIGFAYFIWSGFTGDGFPRFRFEHGFVMFLAIAAAHLPILWRRADHRIRFRNSMVAILASFALIWTGISTLPGGLSR